MRACVCVSKETVGTQEGQGDLQANPTFRMVRNLQPPHVQTVGSNEETIQDPLLSELSFHSFISSFVVVVVVVVVVATSQ